MGMLALLINVSWFFLIYQGYQKFYPKNASQNVKDTGVKFFSAVLLVTSLNLVEIFTAQTVEVVDIVLKTFINIIFWGAIAFGVGVLYGKMFGNYPKENNTK